MQPPQTSVESPTTAPPEPPIPKATSPSMDLSRVAQDLQLRRVQIEAVVQLLDEGNTIPFITRYRKERTGGLNEEAIRQIQSRVGQLRALAERRQTILKSIENQGKLTPDLRAAILAAETTRRLEDLYLPYKPKKKTLASEAKEKGLEPLAQAIWQRDPVAQNLSELLPGMVNTDKGLNSPEEVLQGAKHILAEIMAETADARAAVRVYLWQNAKLASTKTEHVRDNIGQDFKDYFAFAESVRDIPPHRILAINRGEKASVLKTKLELDPQAARDAAAAKLPLDGHPHTDLLQSVLDDCLARLLLPSLEREIRRELTEEAEEHAVRIFARNLRSLLLQPPLRNRRVLAIDPAFRTGCKVALIDENGSLLEHTIVYPFARPEKKNKQHPPKPIAAEVKAETPPESPVSAEPVQATAVPAPLENFGETPTPEVPAEAPKFEIASAPAKVESESVEPEPVEAAPSRDQKARQEALARLEELVRAHRVEIVAIGNGTACRETEEIVAELIGHKLPELAYVIVNEAGASVYSASSVGREEFPDFDATLRGTISIGRRLQDPLSELVKIDPQSIGVGLYQHDIQSKKLKESLDAVVESCVNHVGVDLNTASVPLLRHVSGLNQLVARELVEYRKQHGPFKRREQLLAVPSLGPARFTQSAGFLKIPDSEDPLDRTWIHPESYPATRQLLAELEIDATQLSNAQLADGIREKVKSVSIDALSEKLGVGVPTLRDICEAIVKPGRDPRDDLPPPIFKKGVLKLEDLQTGMELRGTVLNVVDFGAFVDIGLKDSGLVHISQMANKFIRTPYEIVAVGDVVTVWVLQVDLERRRVSLSMIQPGSERKPPERKPAVRQQSDRPPVARPPRRDVAQRPADGGQQRRPPAPRRQARPPQRAGSTGTGSEGSGKPAPKPMVDVRPRKPARTPPKPKLSKAALEGAAPLRTFSELTAFLQARTTPPVAEERPPTTQPEPQPPPTPEPPPPSEGAS